MVFIGTKGIDNEYAIPCDILIATLMPVYDPGPIVTAIKSNWLISVLVLDKQEFIAFGINEEFLQSSYSKTHSLFKNNEVFDFSLTASIEIKFIENVSFFYPHLYSQILYTVYFEVKLIR